MGCSRLEIRLAKQVTLVRVRQAESDDVSKLIQMTIIIAITYFSATATKLQGPFYLIQEPIEAKKK